jgi:hypothetical protein
VDDPRGIEGSMSKITGVFMVVCRCSEKCGSEWEVWGSMRRVGSEGSMRRVVRETKVTRFE